MSHKTAIRSPSSSRKTEIEDYGLARVRDKAFDAVRTLWRRRQAEGMNQIDVARKLNRDPAWVSKQLRGPGNWTLRTFGALVEALDGEAEIIVHALEEPLSPIPNYDAYESINILATPSYHSNTQPTIISSPKAAA